MVANINGTQWPADTVERRPVKSLLPYARNARTHSPEQIQQIAASIREWGFTVPVLVDDAGTLIAGHGRVMAAQSIGLAEVPTMVATGWSAEQIRAYRIADNKLTLNGGWDDDALSFELGELQLAGFDLGLTGFGEHELMGLLGSNAGLTDPDEVPDVPAEPVTQPGDVWLLGRHRLRCGSSNDLGLVEFWGHPDLTLTDPPYCSGGFQESDRSVGSVGTSAKHKQIANDRLSSRGFAALINASVFSIQSSFFYIFTDWRMWLYLFDAAEASGAGVRSMIAWNKGTPGMGLGWRSQHELIMWATRKAPPYVRGFPGIGNVISLPRQRNELHTTQKPVELVRTLLQGAPFGRTVADPFAGSGTTIIACEMEGRDCFACELDPVYCDVSVLRWQAFTGQQATHATTGETYTAKAQAREPALPANG
jgi:DNA modification methylase